MKPFLRAIKIFASIHIISVIMPCSVLTAQPDIGVTALSGPAVPFCAGTHSVDVILENFGTDTVFTANLAWTVNGVSQLSFAFNDTLVPFETQHVIIGSFLFNRKTTYELAVISSDPNGLADADPSNDSLLISNLRSRMSGSYSAGIVADYATLSQAVNDLENRGVCSAVVININPGIFTEQLKIHEVAGASAVNTITFQSSTADSTSVFITFPSSATDLSNFTIMLDGADHFIFNQVTLERRGSLPYSRVVELSRNATGNVFTNLHFAGTQNTTDRSLSAIVYSDSSATDRDTANVFLNSLFTHGASAIYYEGPPLTPESAITITRNRFVDQYAGGLFLMNQHSPQVIQNEFQTNAVNTDYIAVDGLRCGRKTEVVKNNIIKSPGGGIFLSDCKGDSLTRILVANNFIQSGDSAGLVLDRTLFLDAVYNSIEQLSASQEHLALLVSGSTSATRILNNILVNSGGGIAYTINDSANQGLASSDYNDLYAVGATTGRLNGVDLASLADWTLASGLDSHSVSTDPVFVSVTDLHATSYYVDNKGIPLAMVSDDIDGEPRSASASDIGADEFSAVIHDLEISAILSPGDSSCDDAVTTVSLLVHNVGDFDESGFIIHAQISGAAVYQLLDTITATITAGAFDTLTFSQPVNTLGGGVFTIQSFISAFDIEPANDTLLSERTIIPHLPPAVASGTQVCGPDSVLLTASGSHLIYWYDEITGGLLLDTGITLVYFAAGSDTLYVQNGATCPSERIAVPILVHNLPVVFLGNDTLLYYPDTVTLSADTGYVTYLWNTGDTIPSIVVDSTGMYAVTVTDSNGCSGSDTILVDVVTGIGNLDGGSVLQVYPNPATGSVHVEWNSRHHENVVLTIQDVAGRVVYNIQLHADSGLFKTDVGVDRLARGIYLLQLQSGTGITGKRLVLH
jgi:Secretion system C-terminal sorting domain/Right handed beta helix region